MLHFIPTESEAKDLPEGLNATKKTKYILAYVPSLPGFQLPTQSVVGFVTGDLQVDDETQDIIVEPRLFYENAKFADFLHDFLGREVFNSPSLQMKAQEIKSGWMNIIDLRSRFGRAVPSEDIFGNVQLENGKMVPGTYHRMPTHRLFTDEGLFRLDSYLAEKLEDAVVASLTTKGLKGTQRADE